MVVAVALQALALAASAHAWGGSSSSGSSSSSGWWDGGGGSSDSSSSSSSSSSFGFGSFDLDGSSGGGGAGFDVAQARRLRDVHGILAAVAFVALFPLGAILVRCPPLGRSAWLAHALTQLLACGVYAAAAGVGIHLVRTVRVPPGGASLLASARTNAHPIIGLAVLAALALQAGLGWAHHRRFARLGRRTAVSHAHLWLGRAALALGVVNGGLGLGLAAAPRGTVAAYAAVAAVMCALWALAAGVAEARRARAKRAADDDDGGAGDAHELRYAGPPAGMPSPPYTPGLLYGGPQVDTDQRYRTGQAVEVRPVKSSVDRSDTASSLSSRGTPRARV